MNVTFVNFCEEGEMRLIYKKPETVLKQSLVIFLYFSFLLQRLKGCILPGLGMDVYLSS